MMACTAGRYLSIINDGAVLCLHRCSHSGYAVTFAAKIERGGAAECAESDARTPMFE